MITATLSATPLDVSNDITFELIQHGQLCSFDKLKGDVVPSISFPPTERNRNVLNHPNRYEMIRTGVKEYEGFQLRSNGELLISGTLVLTDGFSGYVRGAVGNLSATQKDKLITDHALPENVTFENKTNYDPTTDDYCCPEISNSAFWEGVSKSESYPLNEEEETTYEETILQRKHKNVSYRVNYKDTAGVLINNESINFIGDDASTYQLTVVSPQLFLLNTIKKLLQLNGFFLSEIEFDETHDFRKLCIYNNVDVNSGEGGTKEYGLGKETKDGDVWILSFVEIKTITRQISAFNYTDLLPKSTLKDFLLGFQNLTNSVFVIDNNNTIKLIDREARLIGSSNNIDSYFIGDWELGEKKDIALKFKMNHDSADKLFGDFYEDLSDRIDDFGEDVSDFSILETTEGAFLGELRRVTSEGRIYEWVSTVSIDEDDALALEKQVFAWQFISVDYQPGLYNYAYNKEVEEIETCFSTLIGTQMPQTRQAGQTNLRKKESAPFTPRVLFYTGTGNGRNNTDSFNLNFTGTNNLITTRYRKTAEWWANRQAVVGSALFPANIRQSLDLNQKQTTRRGEFIIDKMVTSFTHSGPGTSKIEGYKVD